MTSWVRLVVVVGFAVLLGSLVFAAPTSFPPGGLAIALAASVAAGLAQLRLRFGSYVVAFEWGETALLLQFVLLGVRWVPALMALGFCLSNLIGGRRQVAKVAYNTAAWFLSATAAVQVIRAFTSPHNVFTLGGVVGLALGSATFALGTRVLTAAVVSIAEGRSFATLLREGAGLSAVVCAGNVAAGLVILALARWSPWSLALLPPSLFASQVAYRGRAKAHQDRDAWRGLAEATQPVIGDTESTVLSVAAARAVELFDAHHIMVLLHMSAEGEPTWVSLAPANAEADFAAAPYSVEVMLDGPTASVRALRLCFTAPVTLSAEERQSLRTYAHWLAGTIEQTRLTARKAYAAAHDALTGLANRTTLFERGDVALAAAAAAEGVVALLLIDLDHFKEVNDTLGHGAGDVLLRIVSERLLDAADEHSLVARLGGDEFAILLTGLTEPEAAFASAEAFAEALRVPVEVDSYRLAVEGSIGVACYPQDATSMSDLLRRADVATYQAKSNPAGVARYDQRKDGTSVDRLSLLPEFKSALASGQIVLHYQPKYDLATRRPVGAEALARWLHPEQNVLPPDLWVPAVEQSTLIRDFTAYVLDHAIADCVTWPDESRSVAVNLSARSLLDHELPGLVASLLERHELPARSLVLEITETVMMSSLETVEQTLSALRALGVRISVDDFGTGYSSLTFLARQAVDEVKVDRSFVASMAHSEEAAAIVRSVVDLAAAFRLDVVAEGVETPDQEAALSRLGCRIAQGYWYCKPVPSARIREQLEAGLQADDRGGVLPVQRLGTFASRSA